MCMKNSELDGEFDKLAEGKVKRFSRVNLKETIDFLNTISSISDRDGDEVFGE